MNAKPFPIVPLLFGCALSLLAARSHAAEFFVPSFDSPTLQDAINDAAGSEQVENTIFIGTSPIIESVSIGGDFDSGHHLTICPDAGAGLGRATVVASAFNTPVFSLIGAAGSDQGYVTIQDLDILRTGSGSASHLVLVSGMQHVTIERCRIGLNWTTPGPNGFSNLRIEYPTEVIVRNCILFSATPGNFDHAIHVFNMADPSNSIKLYNNLAADYRLSGYRIFDGASSAGTIVLLRNNIAVNHMGVAPEPYGYRSEVEEASIVSSHNVVFCTPGNEESLAIGAGSIGNGPANGISLLRATAVISFATLTWTIAPPWDVNPLFFRLNPAGALHDADTDYGITVDTDGAPHAADIANFLDIERQGRPGGAPNLHTDRGPDQSDPAAATGAVEIAAHAGEGVLRARPERNPSREVAIELTCAQAGVLTLELFDLSGRHVARDVWTVRSGAHEVWRPHASLQPGLVFFRATLQASDGSVHASFGKAVALR